MFTTVTQMGRLMVCLAGAALLLTGAGIASAADKTDADRRFDAFLNSIDIVPKSRAELERAFPDAQQRLLAAAADEGRKGYSRHRAISFLSFYPDAATRSALVKIAASQDKDVRRYSVYTAARTFGQPGDAALVTFIKAGTADSHEDVRTFSVRALRWVDHADAGRLLDHLAKGNDKALAQLAQVTARKRLQRLKR